MFLIITFLLGQNCPRHPGDNVQCLLCRAICVSSDFLEQVLMVDWWCDFEPRKEVNHLRQWHTWEAGKAKWWHYEPSTNVARFHSTLVSYVAWVCCRFLLCSEDFFSVLLFSSLIKKQRLQILICQRYTLYRTGMKTSKGWMMQLSL